MLTLSLQEQKKTKKTQYFPRLVGSQKVMGDQPMSLGNRYASLGSKNEIIQLSDQIKCIKEFYS